MNMTDKIECAKIDAASYRDNSRINYRARVQALLNAEAAAQAAKEDLVSAMASYNYDSQTAAQAAVKRTELALGGATAELAAARAAVEACDTHLADFARDVFALHAHDFNLHDAKVVVAKFKPEEEPKHKTLVIAQHERGPLHGDGTMSGDIKAWGYGGASLDGETVREIFGRYSTTGIRGVTFGNYPAYAISLGGAWSPEPVVTTPSARGLAQIFANLGTTLNQGFASTDQVRLWAEVPSEGFDGSVEGATVTASGAVAVGCYDLRVEGYTTGAIADKMTSIIEGYGIGKFASGVGIVENIKVTARKPADPNGVLIEFTATGRRKAQK